VVALVRAELLECSERGVVKYSTTLARTDLDRAAWLRHLYEELLGPALYTRRLMLDEELRETAVAPPLTSLEVELIEKAWAGSED